MRAKRLSSECFYCPVTNFLQQGDVFALELVAPQADTNQFIFRAADGRHGSVVFADGVDAQVFERQELEHLLREAPTSALHTRPFAPTNDGCLELVVVHAKLLKYFVIATQTCDISGEDKACRPEALVLPIVTLQEICQSTALPGLRTDAADTDQTIHDYLVDVCQQKELAVMKDIAQYGKVLRESIASAPVRDPEVKRNVGRIRDFVNKYLKKGFLYYLQSDESFGIPEACVDYSVAYTVGTPVLRELSHRRIARIGDPYRDQFARRFADWISRIAVPTPMTPDNL